MIQNAIQMLQGQAAGSTQALVKIRTEITDSFSKDYVVGTMTMERLISVQHSVHQWAKITRILERAEGEQAQVAGLREWAHATAERMLECGRSSSTSHVANASTLSEEEETKRVLQMVRQALIHIDNCK
jgi:hypothetical protein